MNEITAFVVSCACALAGASAARAETVGEAAPITVSTALPSNITPGIPGISSNPTLAKTPAANPTPTPPEARAGTDATADAVMQVAAPSATTKTSPGLGASAEAPAVAADKPTNEELQRTRVVRAALTKSFPQTPGANGAAPTGGIAGLRVTTHGGKVILRGAVATQQLKDAAAARAASLVGGADNVDNRLIVQ